MNSKKLLYYSWVVALAGFCFGFDTVVISGADTQLQAQWQTSDFFHGFVVMSMALWGTVIGAIFGAIPANRFGRRQTLIWIGILYSISAIGTAMATGPYMFAAFRFLGGLGIGASTIAAPAYVSEISDPRNRGRMVALYQFNIVFGILMAFTSNYFFRDIGDNAWRWMLGIEAVPAILYTILVLGVPESPRWLMVYKNDSATAARILKGIYPEGDINRELESIRSEKKDTGGTESIFMKKYSVPLMLAFCIAFFNQMSGINALLYYAPRIFELSGLEKSTSFLSSIGIGMVNLIFTLVGITLIDRYGRKKLMYIGSVGYIVALGLVSLAFGLQWKGFFIPVFFFLFIASHAVGQGAVIWVFIAEIFPNKLRAAGQAFGSSVHWLLAALIPSLIPFLFSSVGPAAVFGSFCFMMVGQLLWVIFRMPETKGQTLESLAEKLAKP